MLSHFTEEAAGARGTSNLPKNTQVIRRQDLDPNTGLLTPIPRSGLLPVITGYSTASDTDKTD